jgi:nucleoside-diphosphate-sugar epimerase
MSAVLITGGSGFFGGVLKARLLAEGFDCVNVDLQPDPVEHPALVSIQGDIRDTALLERLFAEYRFSAVFHCAAILAHDVQQRGSLWTSNVAGTVEIARLTARHDVPKIVYISSNCLWTAPFNRPVREDDVPAPGEIYGASKWAAERALAYYCDPERLVILRPPTIIASGRLGLLSILFDFILEGRRVWVVGDGSNRYQFVYAPDLADACVRALAPAASGVFNVGSADVPTLRDTYQYVIDRAGTRARVASLPRWPTLPLMRLSYQLRLSPLGPYQYRMIAASFEFDTSRIQRTLGWRPTLTNGEMLFEAFDYYRHHVDEIDDRTAMSAHKQRARMGVIRLLKQLS